MTDERYESLIDSLIPLDYAMDQLIAQAKERATTPEDWDMLRQAEEAHEEYKYGLTLMKHSARTIFSYTEAIFHTKEPENASFAEFDAAFSLSYTDEDDDEEEKEPSWDA